MQSLLKKIRWCIFPIDAVLPFRGDYVKEYSLIPGSFLKVKMGSLRYRVFAESLSCYVCGISGEYFALEGEDSRTAHFNLYALDKKGREILMTKSYIVPVSKGGSESSINNLRTMCNVCRMTKGYKEMSSDEILAQRHMTHICSHLKDYRWATKDDIKEEKDDLLKG